MNLKSLFKKQPKPTTTNDFKKGTFKITIFHPEEEKKYTYTGCTDVEPLLYMIRFRDELGFKHAYSGVTYEAHEEI